MKHTISVLVKNEPGMLSYVCDLFSSRGFNIESLSVAATMDPNFSRITIVTIGDNVIIGAGSVVVKDLPSNVLAVGNPCKVIREI